MKELTWTFVPRRSNSLANGNMPRIISAPELSTKITAYKIWEKLRYIYTLVLYEYFIINMLMQNFNIDSYCTNMYKTIYKKHCIKNGLPLNYVWMIQGFD